MESKGIRTRVLTPSKNPQATNLKDCENVDPNTRSPLLKQSKSPVTKSATKFNRSASKNPKPVILPSPRNKLRERRFVVVKRNSKKENVKPNITCKCEDTLGGNSKRCLCAAYESLRVSQEEFFKQGNINDNQLDSEVLNVDREDRELDKVESSNEDLIQDTTELVPEEMGLKRRREKVLEEARTSVPETGSGSVRHLVKAFERLLTIPKSENSDQKKDENEQDEKKKAIRWALPGMQQPDVPLQLSSSSFCPSDFMVTSESLGLDSRVSSSLNSIQGSFMSNRFSGGSRRSRRNSSGSHGALGGSKWKKKRQLKLTRQQPFNLRTEQRGRCKEEALTKKLQEMKIEEEKLRIPVAQGLPWTTDEPQCLVKPPVKESTIPVDLKLHSDIRAVERAEFDNQVTEKTNLIEQYKMEKQKQQKLEEEEEIKRIRKELVPRAQPLPYFDRPFVPRRSTRQPTIPKEPKFHLASPKHNHHHKRIKSCSSCNNINAV
ncbi:uncharacterized protein LOC124937479 [Impatiens glandulifera]|uniref:uncharacterized protein LOC124937479 n=1 Tax=Impatiens glandulifera TaxID=253017 RepID=UPI001FB0D9D2|nr:uncharacterized protein LOC124937479 [Impatiens glandulifera]